MATETSRNVADAETQIPASVSEHLTLEDRTGLLRAMLGMRAIEERAMLLYRQGKVPGSFYDGYGQEAVSAGPAWAMHGHDRLCILHRDLAAHIIRGVPPARIFAQYMGRAGGVTLSHAHAWEPVVVRTAPLTCRGCESGSRQSESAKMRMAPPAVRMYSTLPAEIQL